MKLYIALFLLLIVSASSCKKESVKSEIAAQVTAVSPVSNDLTTAYIAVIDANGDTLKSDVVIVTK